MTQIDRAIVTHLSNVSHFLPIDDRRPSDLEHFWSTLWAPQEARPPWSHRWWRRFARVGFKRPGGQASKRPAKPASEQARRTSEQASERTSERVSEQASKRASERRIRYTQHTTSNKQRTANNKQQAASNKQQATKHAEHDRQDTTVDAQRGTVVESASAMG